MSSSSVAHGRTMTLWRMLRALQKHQQQQPRHQPPPPLLFFAQQCAARSAAVAPGEQRASLSTTVAPMIGHRSSSTWARGSNGNSGGAGSALATTPAAAAATTRGGPVLLGRPAPSSFSTAATTASSAPTAGRVGRFYDTVRIAPVPDPGALQRQAGRQPPPPPPPSPARPPNAPWWQLLLRGYPVKTPGQNALLLPTRALALAVAGEWEWLDQGRPLSVAMPLTALCATASDQPKPRAAVEQGLLKFVHTDAAAVRHDPGTTLARKQADAFDHLLAWAADPEGPIRCPGGPLVPSSDIAGAPQSPAAEAAFARHLASLDAWTLAAVDQATAASKSLVVGCALAAGRVSVREAARCARLEEDHQADEWGAVEAAHDLDACDALARVGAAALLVRLLRMD